MIHTILLEKSNKGFSWHKNQAVYVCGYAFSGDCYLEGKKLSEHLGESKDINEFKTKTAQLNGIFTAIFINNDKAAAFVDRYGVYKLFYTKNGPDFFIGDKTVEIHG